MEMEKTVEMEKMNERATGYAMILAIGTANPPHTINQPSFPDFYFGITNDRHISDPFKAKFSRICEKSMIKTRYTHLTADLVKEKENMGDYMSPSLNTRQRITTAEVPKLGKEAAENAVKEWGRQVSDITHLVMCTYSTGDMPGADYHLAKLLCLSPSVNRYMLYQQGCHGGGSVLRLAKDLAENNRGARVLAVCSEINVIGFRGPSETDINNIVGQVLFGDGAGAVIVGADPITCIERPIFTLVSTMQTILPNSDGAIGGQLCEAGLLLKLREDISKLISDNLESCLTEAFSTLQIHDWNSIFWITHPGGPTILDCVEANLALKKEKLRATRQVLKDYGNMSSASVLFILDEMRNKSKQNGHATTGEGLDWGVLFGFGPGITVETVVLHSMPITE